MKKFLVFWAIGLLNLANVQSFCQNTHVITIDHVPIVVGNLELTKKILSEQLHFKVKEGKTHEGIKNCFIKFQDGTYLEFITPIDTSYSIGKYYANFQKSRQGATDLALSVKNSNSITSFLIQKSIPFEIDSNRIWKTIQPKDYDLFYIEYADKNWKDSKINTTHLNQSLSLKSTYVIDNKLHNWAKEFKNLGFSVDGMEKLWDIPYQKVIIGSSNLCLFEFSQSKKIRSKFKSLDLYGICGFEIKVENLEELKKLIPKANNIVIGKSSIIYFFYDDNFFLEFTE
ncbi:MAG: VOC family protein [Arcicella sp.]|jgi:hypothetical protein|nr:VOC family protein [Arcicella sp.]